VPAGSALIALVPERSAYFFCAEDSPEWVFRWIDFEGESAMQLWGALRSRFGPVVHLGAESGAGRALGRLIDDVADRRFSGLQVQAEAAHSAFLGCWFQLESLEAAERFLLRSSLSIREIALRTGHAGPAQFTRSFIAANGKSPRAFRNR
jgi:hypothetical protein